MKMSEKKTTHKDKKDKIINDNGKGTCMLIDVAILRERVMYAFSIKEINFYAINNLMYGTGQLKICCFFQNEEFEFIQLLILYFNAVMNGALLPSTSLTLQEVLVICPLTYIHSLTSKVFRFACT
jgi:hypothetical protein